VNNTGNQRNDFLRSKLNFHVKYELNKYFINLELLDKFTHNFGFEFQSIRMLRFTSKCE